MLQVDPYFFGFATRHLISTTAQSRCYPFWKFPMEFPLDPLFWLQNRSLMNIVAENLQGWRRRQVWIDSCYITVYLWGRSLLIGCMCLPGSILLVSIVIRRWTRPGLKYSVVLCSLVCVVNHWSVGWIWVVGIPRVVQDPVLHMPQSVVQNKAEVTDGVSCGLWSPPDAKTWPIEQRYWYMIY